MAQDERGAACPRCLTTMPGVACSSRRCEEATMREVIKLVSSADTGYCYYTTKNKRTMTEKLQLKKYDPIARKHVVFTEGKISRGGGG